MTSEPYIGAAAQLAQLGRFELIERIGSGGMADVYVGRDPHGRLSAIKILHPELAREYAVASRFVNEARVVAAILHPNVVAVHEAGEVDGHAYFTMEYLEGETLSQLVRRQRLSAAKVVSVSRQIAAGLAAAHAASVVHRDLKPSNVMLVGDGGEWVRVLDFGIAKVLDGGADAQDLTRTGALLGTPRYMSPEQCRSASDIDHRSDIYSLGCVMYFMATGRPPFEADSIGELLGMQLYIEPEAPSVRVPDLPPALSDLIVRCLRKDADDRPGSMAEVIAALDRVIPPLGGYDPIVAAQPIAPSRARRALVIGGAAIGAVAVAAIVVAAIPDDREPAIGRPRPVDTPTMSTRPAEPTPAPAPALSTATIQFTFASDPPGAKVFLEPDRTALGSTPVVLQLPPRDQPVVFSIEKVGHVPVKVALPGDRGSVQSIALPELDRNHRRRSAAGRTPPADPVDPTPPAPRIDADTGTLDPFEKYPRAGDP